MQLLPDQVCGRSVWLADGALVTELTACRGWHGPRCVVRCDAERACRFQDIVGVELVKGHWRGGLYVVVTASQPPHKVEVRFKCPALWFLL